MNESITSERIKKLELENDLYLKQKDIAILEQQKKSELLKRNSLIGVVAFVLVVAFLIFRSQRKRIRFEKIKAEKDRANHELQQKLLSAELSAAQQEIDFNKRQLEQFTKSLVEKAPCLKKSRAKNQKERQTRLQLKKLN